MKILNFTFGQKRPDQYKLGLGNNFTGSHFGIGLTFSIDEFNLYSQIKDYRTDLLNGTNWRPIDQMKSEDFSYLQFIRLLNKYSTAIFNDYNRLGFAVFAKIDNQIFYISERNYTKFENKIKVKGFPEAETFEFDEPNFFCGEDTIWKKCEPYQKLYNVALSCQKNGMTKSGFVNVVSPKSRATMPTKARFTEIEINEMEKRISWNHGIANDDQTNFLIFQEEVDVRTITYDFTKLGILETKKLCEEFVCSKLGVPFVLLPSEGQTFANYEEANKILYQNHSKYCEYFTNFAKDELGFEIDYKTIAEEGKGII